MQKLRLQKMNRKLAAHFKVSSLTFFPFYFYDFFILFSQWYLIFDAYWSILCENLHDDKIIIFSIHFVSIMTGQTLFIFSNVVRSNVKIVWKTKTWERSFSFLDGIVVKFTIIAFFMVTINNEPLIVRRVFTSDYAIRLKLFALHFVKISQRMK